MSGDRILHSSLFAQFMGFKAAPEWRQLPAAERTAGREAFARAVDESAPDITTESYSTIGFKNEVDLLLWRKADFPIAVPEMTARLLQSGIGCYLQPTLSLFGFTRPSIYTKRQTAQDQAIHEEQRGTFLLISAQGTKPSNRTA